MCGALAQTRNILRPELSGDCQRPASRRAISMEQAKADNSGHDQVECDDVIEQSWHDQDEDPCDQGDDRLKMGDGEKSWSFSLYCRKAVKSQNSSSNPLCSRIGQVERRRRDEFRPQISAARTQGA